MVLPTWAAVNCVVSGSMLRVVFCWAVDNGIIVMAEITKTDSIMVVSSFFDFMFLAPLLR
jgi:hypothetical protein